MVISNKSEFISAWKSFFEYLFQPYKDFIHWALDFFFPGLLKKESRKVLLNIESMLALVETLGPKPIEREVMSGAEPIYIEGKKDVGVLMVHGFGSSPGEFKELARLLNEKKKHTIYAIRLLGHGTSVSDQWSSDFLDWYYSAVKAYDFLKKKGCKHIYLIGHSMGGTLVLLLAATRKVDAVVSLNAPLDLGTFYHGLYMPALQYVSKFIRKWPRRKESIVLHKKHNSPTYTEHALKGVVEMFDLLEVTRDEIKKLEAPLLNVGSKDDYHVPLSNHDMLGNLVKSPRVEKFLAKRSGHAVLLDKEKKVIFQKILDFLDSLDHESDKETNGDQ